MFVVCNKCTGGCGLTRLPYSCHIDMNNHLMNAVILYGLNIISQILPVRFYAPPSDDKDENHFDLHSFLLPFPPPFIIANSFKWYHLTKRLMVLHRRLTFMSRIICSHVMFKDLFVKLSFNGATIFLLFFRILSYSMFSHSNAIPLVLYQSIWLIQVPTVSQQTRNYHWWFHPLVTGPRCSTLFV